MPSEHTPRVTVVVPVKDGARYLGELLEAVAGQRVDAEVEVLVVDSGSRDDSVEIARGRGARIIEIAPEEFGHGRTRNLAAERSAGDVIVFLTQDATPASETWLARLVAPLDPAARVGMSFGPHLPRPGTSPMIARELTEFFGSFTAEELRVDAEPDPSDPATGFFSNVNSAVLRECWDEVRFRDVQYAEDQAFARDAMAAGWRKAFVPAAGALHAHDYPFAEFMRRYFDEYRGLRETIGHVEPLGPARLAHNVRAQVGRDLGYMRAQGVSGPARAAWSLRSARHHAGRAIASALGSRHERMPQRVAQRLSLEGRGGSRQGGGLTRRRAHHRPYAYESVREFAHRGPAPLEPSSPHDGERALWHIAWVVPPFRRGSGGHMALFRIALELEARGHSCSIWIQDDVGMMDGRVALARREIVDHFAPLRGGVFNTFDDWHGADVALATGWQTAYPVAMLPAVKLKAYLVQDHEPDFYPASAERMWAESTYGLGLPCLPSSPWLEQVVRDRYGVERAQAFEYGVDFDVYRPSGGPRDPRTVLFYARPATPRRATELGMLALEELLADRPDTRVVIFGDSKPPPAPFDYEFAGVLEPAALAGLYGRATVGLVLSLTNYSLVPKEMMACGLPVVDVRGASAESVFGRGDGVIELAAPEPLALAQSVGSLLDDADRRTAMAAAAQRFVAGMTWTAAADQIERALRGWMRDRWDESLRAATRPDQALTEAGAHLS
jgi:glycosyltransferase involved in cell wall biosynthesis